MTLKRAIVTSVGPLRIMIDGDTEPIPFTPKSLIDPATLAVGDVVHADQSGHRLVVLGRVGGLGLVSGRNLIINGDFRINQRGYVSGDANGSVYRFDRWRTERGGATTFTESSQGQVITLADGATAEQVIEERDMPAGDYVVSWVGTANIAVIGETTYLTSPFVYSHDGVGNVSIRAYAYPGSSKTLHNVKVERGTNPTPFVPRLYGEEFALCQRYYRKMGPAGGGTSSLAGFGSQFSTTLGQVPILFSPPMRGASTLTYGGKVGWTDEISFAVDATPSLSRASKDSALISATFVANGASQRPGTLRSDDGTGWLAFDAEL